MSGPFRVLRLWRWRVDLRRGGRATPWPWFEIVISRCKPKRGPAGPPEVDR